MAVTIDKISAGRSMLQTIKSDAAIASGQIAVVDIPRNAKVESILYKASDNAAPAATGAFTAAITAQAKGTDGREVNGFITLTANTFPAGASILVKTIQ